MHTQWGKTWTIYPKIRLTVITIYHRLSTLKHRYVFHWWTFSHNHASSPFPSLTKYTTGFRSSRDNFPSEMHSALSQRLRMLFTFQGFIQDFFFGGRGNAVSACRCYLADCKPTHVWQRAQYNVGVNKFKVHLILW